LSYSANATAANPVAG